MPTKKVDHTGDYDDDAPNVVNDVVDIGPQSQMQQQGVQPNGVLT